MGERGKRVFGLLEVVKEIVYWLGLSDGKKKGR